ncbi:MAG: cadherin-like domain-containing protein [Saprospiraceae bacterium]|nr:cadherin-like domain-containing protein [Candidatus Opimibacter skivensis]
MNRQLYTCKKENLSYRNSGPTLNATVAGNTFPGSASDQSNFTGIFVPTGGPIGTMSFAINNNQIHQIPGNAHIFAKRLSGFLIILALLAFICNDAKATNITVNTTLDEVNGNTSSVANLIASPGGAGISLREAIIATNNTPGADAIFFTNPAGSPDIYALTIIASDNNAAGGDLDINDNLTINGNGKNETVIQMMPPAMGNCDCKVIGINQDGMHLGLTVVINALTITGGKNNFIASGTFQETGGGVDVFLTGTGNSISFNDVKISNNTAVGSVQSYGGGVNIDSGTSGLPGDIPINTASRGTVTFTNCDITGNTADATGGGLNLFADIHNVTFSNCNITNNQTLGPAGLGAAGGGMFIRHSYGGTVTYNNGTISTNTGIGYGGGVCIVQTQTTNITGTTVNGNTVTNGTLTFAIGGGIYQSGSLPVTLSNVTISGNHADAGAGAGGGGIFADAGPISMTGGSITGNTAREGGGVCIEDANITLTNLTISTNTAAVNGGGLLIRSTATGTTTLDGVTLNSNIADSDNNSSGDGGGIYRAAGTLNLNNTINVGSTGLGNTAVNGGGIANTGGNLSKTTGLLTVAANNAKNNGGGYYITGGTINFQKTVIINNTANSDNSGGGEGGGIYNAGGALTLNFNRIALNIANANAPSNAMRHVSGTITNIQNNWWGTNSPATVINGTASYTPYLQLLHTPASNLICQNTSTGLTASFVNNSANTNVLANIDRLIGLPITFNNVTPAGSTISGAQTTIQANGQATATYNAGSTAGVGGADAVVDNFASHATITVQSIPNVTLDPLSQSICPGDPVTFTTSATGNPVPTVQWQVSTNGGMSFSNIGGATNTTLMFNVATVDNANQYRAIFSNACGIDTSNAAILTVYPVENPDFAYEKNGYCQAGADPVPIIYGNSGGIFTAPAQLIINSATGQIDVSASTAGGPYIITYTTGGPCPESANFSITIVNCIPGATLTDALIIDNGVNGKAEPGDRIRLTATISNTQSADYEGMQIVLNNDPRVTFVTASFKSTPVAVNDLYAGTLNTILTVTMANGVLQNDFDDNIPGLSVTSFDGMSTQGGTVSVNPNGSFTYNPMNGFTGNDTYNYTITDTDLQINVATVKIHIQ